MARRIARRWCICLENVHFFASLKMRRRCEANDQCLCAPTASVTDFAVGAGATRRREGAARRGARHQLMKFCAHIWCVMRGVRLIGAWRQRRTCGGHASPRAVIRSLRRRKLCGLLPRAARSAYLFEILRGRDDLRATFGLELFNRDKVTQTTRGHPKDAVCGWSRQPSGVPRERHFNEELVHLQDPHRVHLV